MLERGRSPINLVINRTTMYYDYKLVDGVKYAHKINQAVGLQVFDLVIKSVEHNTKLGDDVF